jgi:hypothetical protein
VGQGIKRCLPRFSKHATGGDFNANFVALGSGSGEMADSGIPVGLVEDCFEPFDQATNHAVFGSTRPVSNCYQLSITPYVFLCFGPRSHKVLDGCVELHY